MYINLWQTAYVIHKTYHFFTDVRFHSAMQFGADIILCKKPARRST